MSSPCTEKESGTHKDNSMFQPCINNEIKSGNKEATHTLTLSETETETKTDTKATGDQQMSLDPDDNDDDACGYVWYPLQDEDTNIVFVVPGFRSSNEETPAIAHFHKLDLLRMNNEALLEIFANADVKCNPDTKKAEEWIITLPSDLFLNSYVMASFFASLDPASTGLTSYECKCIFKAGIEVCECQGDNKSPLYEMLLVEVAFVEHFFGIVHKDISKSWCYRMMECLSALSRAALLRASSFSQNKFVEYCTYRRIEDDYKKAPSDKQKNVILSEDNWRASVICARWSMFDRSMGIAHGSSLHEEEFFSILERQKHGLF